MNTKDILAPEDYERYRRQVPGMQPGSSLRVERRLRHKNGNTVLVESSIKALHDGRILSIVRDVTMRKQAEESLRLSEERYRSLVQQSSEGIFVFDPYSMRIQEANAAMLAMLGYRPDEITQMKLYDVVAETPASIDDNVKKTLRDGRFQVTNRRYRRKDGSLIDVEVRGTVIHYGRSELVLGNVVDLTERKSTEFELQMITEQLRTVSSAMTEFLGTGNWNDASRILLHGALTQTQSQYGLVGVMIENLPMMALPGNRRPIGSSSRQRTKATGHWAIFLFLTWKTCLAASSLQATQLFPTIPPLIRRRRAIFRWATLL